MMRCVDHHHKHRNHHYPQNTRAMNYGALITKSRLLFRSSSTVVASSLRVAKTRVWSSLASSDVDAGGRVTAADQEGTGAGGVGSWRSMEGVVRCAANYAPLTPISFLERASKVFGDRISVVYGSLRFTWTQTYHRCLRLASALSRRLRLSPGHVVATLCPNVPAMIELHFGVPMAGGILCTLNTRLDSAMLSVLIEHSEAKVIFVDHQLLDVAQGAFHLLAEKEATLPILVVVREHNCSDASAIGSVDHEYENLVANGDIDGFQVKRPLDEWDPISINYTSGTTSQPKGVVYHHRGGYLNAIATFLLHGMSTTPTYLWTVPMFHCNGWCLAWGVAALGGTNVCIRKVTPEAIFENILLHNVTHMGAAPTVLNMIVNSSPSAGESRKSLPHKVLAMTGGSPPPPQVLFKMEELGFEVSHLYGLTETFGPGTYNVWKPEWDSLPPEERSRLKARQGMLHLCLEDVDVKNPTTMESIIADGETAGEVMFKGNTVMSGYFKDLKATEEAFKGGWFRSGDLAVKHPDGFIEVKDRMKDIVISGGENICTVQIETVLYSHPAVLEAAVVPRPDDHWGQTPCAFVKLKQGCNSNEQELIAFCRERLPHYMAPKTVVFEEELPKTATGKIQKFNLREKARAIGSFPYS